MLFHNKLFLLKHESHDLFFPPQVVEAISKFRTIMNSNSLLHANQPNLTKVQLPMMQ